MIHQGTIKSQTEQAIYRRIGKLLDQVKRRAWERIRVGENALALARAIEADIIAVGGKPCFKGYQGFPEAACISVNNVLIHGIPRADIIFAAGDIVSVDIGIRYQGFCGDSAFTRALSENVIDKRLIQASKEALWAAAEVLRDGVTVAEVETAIGAVIDQYGLQTTPHFSGHGIGRTIHEEPSIFNYPYHSSQKEIYLRAGMIVCIEPMILQQSPNTQILSDGWTVVSADGRNTAHEEWMFLITNDGAEILSGEVVT